MNDVATAWWEWTAAMSAQIAVLAAIVALLDATVLRRAGPLLRVVPWSVVFAKLLLPPTLSSPVSVAQLGVGVGVGVDGSVSVPSAFAVGEVAPVLFAVWLAGIAVLAPIAVARAARVRRAWLGGAAPPAHCAALAARVAERIGLRAPLRVTVRAGVRTAAVVGWLRPVVVLPAELVATATPRQLEHVMLHEAIHVKRGDPLACAVCDLLTLLYWFHPAVWIARSRLSTLREMRCDEAVAAALGGTRGYRRTLLELAGVARPPMSAPGPAMLSRRSQLLTRLRELERWGRGADRGRRSRGAAALLLTALVACCVPLAPPADFASEPELAAGTVARPPGCLQLRYLVMRRLAEQEGLAPN